MYDRNETVWGSADGREVLIKDLATPHLVNILNWIKTNNTTYSDSLYHFMEEEAQYRVTIAFCTNDVIPVKLDTGFYTVKNQTLKGRLKSLILHKKARLIIAWNNSPNKFKSLIVKALKTKKR